MNPDDDTLGAPTDRYGQSVTFSFDASQGTPSLDSGNTSLIRNGVIDGGSGAGTVNPGGTQGSRVADTPVSGTMTLLGKIADSAVAGALKKRQTEAYVEGMQRAMQGEAVTQIAQDQPWYSKIFGDSDVVEGARAYTGHTVAQTTAAQMTEDMPKLRAMDGPTAQRYFTDAVTNSLTGDPATDLSIQNALVQVLPGVMRQQAKEHYGWLQSQATAAEDTAFASSTTALQAQGQGLSDGTITPMDFRKQQIAWVQNQVPAAGRDEKNWQEAQTRRLINAAKNGQFHALGAAQIPIGADENGQGGHSLLSTLTEEQQTQVQTAMKTGAELTRQNYMAEIAPSIADTKMRAETMPPGTTATALYQRMLTDNAQYKAQTGAPNAIWTPEEQVATLKGAGVALFHIEDEQAKKTAALTDKTAKTMQITSDIVDGLNKGNLYNVSKTPEHGTDLIDTTVQPILRAMPVPQQNQALVLNRGYVIGPVSVERDQQVEASVDAAAAGKDASFSDSTQAAYTGWLDLYNKSPSVAAAYYPKSGPKLLAFKNMQDAGMPTTVAFQNAFVKPLPVTQVDSKIKAQAISAVQAEENHWFQANMNPDAVNFLAGMIDGPAAIWAGATGDPAGGAKTAFQSLKASGKVEMGGGYAWPSVSDPAKQFMPALTKFYGGQVLKAAQSDGRIAMPTDTVDSVLHDAIGAFTSGWRVTNDQGDTTMTAGIATGHKTVHTLVLPTTDSKGRPALAISIQAEDGHMYNGTMPYTQVYDYQKAYKASNINAGAGTKHGIGSPFSSPGNTEADRISNRPNLVGYNPNPN